MKRLLFAPKYSFAYCFVIALSTACLANVGWVACIVSVVIGVPLTCTLEAWAMKE